VSRFVTALALALTIAFAGSASAASKIEEIVSPGGIKAWLVRDNTVPLLSLDYAFTGGANADPADKPGLAHMVGALLDEGAGDLDSRTFQERMANLRAQIEEPGVVVDVVGPRPRQVDRDVGDDPCRSR